MGTLRLRSQPSGSATPAAGWNRALTAAEIVGLRTGSMNKYDVAVVQSGPQVYLMLEGTKSGADFGTYDNAVLGSSPYVWLLLDGTIAGATYPSYDSAVATSAPQVYLPLEGTTGTP